MNVELLDGDEVGRRCGFVEAVDRLEAVLRAGFDPEDDIPRQVIDTDAGHLLVMPSVVDGRSAVKLATVGGDPTIQGLVVTFDRETFAPKAILDGIALTNLRTASVSALAVRHLTPADASRLLIFGRGPQARAHADAISQVRPIEQVEMVGRDTVVAPEDLVAADIICCCSRSREPLFDGSLVSDRATVVAIGSHEPDARETDDALAARSTVVVESRASALREAGDVILAIESGALTSGELVGLAEVVRGDVSVSGDRPRFFKGSGMSWQDNVVSALITAEM